MRTLAIVSFCICATVATSRAETEQSRLVLEGQGIRADVTAPDGLSWTAGIARKGDAEGTATVLRLVDRSTKSQAFAEFSLWRGCTQPPAGSAPIIDKKGPGRSTIRVFQVGHDLELMACMEPIVDAKRARTLPFQIRGLFPSFLDDTEAFVTALVTDIADAIETNEPAGLTPSKRHAGFDWTSIGVDAGQAVPLPNGNEGTLNINAIGQGWAPAERGLRKVFLQLAPSLGNEIEATRIRNFPRGCEAYLRAKASKLEGSVLSAFDALPEPYASLILAYPDSGLSNEAFGFDAAPMQHSFDLCMDLPGGALLINVDSPLDPGRAVRHVEPLLRFFAGLRY